MARRAGVVARLKRPRRTLAKASVPPTRKGSKSRDNLKAAALRALEHKGYRALRLNDIAKEADVNISLVYHYFHDKADLVFQALRDVIDIRTAIEGDPARPHEPFAALYHANLLFASFYRDHPGLIRALVHFDEEHPEFHDLYSRVNRDWNQRIAETIRRRCPDAMLSDGEALAVAFAVGGMVDKFLFEVYVERNPVLLAELPTPEDVARFLTFMWFRAIYLRNPSTADIGKFGKLARMALSVKDK